jgi:hypothetical protein
MKIIYYIRRFIALSKNEKRIYFFAFLISGIARFLTFTFPLKFYLSLMKPKFSSRSQGNSDNEHYKRIIKMIDKISRHLPWDTNCLVKALTAKVLLGIYGIDTIVILRISKSNSHTIFAHALVRQSNYDQSIMKKGFTEFIIGNK